MEPQEANESGWLTVFGFEEKAPQDLLMEAIEQRSYPTIYAQLRRQEQDYSPERAFQLCMLALKHNLTQKAFLAILDHCPPLEQIMRCGRQENRYAGLMESAAANDRVDILELLLCRGGNLNRKGHYLSPLEAAVENGALNSVERLLREPELDTRMTARLLNCWSFVDDGQVAMDFCLQAASPRLLGKQVTFQDPFPTPDQMTLHLAARAGNWKLVSRLCAQREDLTSRDAKAALKRCPMKIPYRWDLDEEMVLDTEVEQAQALNDLLTIFPELLRMSRTKQLLVHSAVCFPLQTSDILAPWLQNIQSQKVLLEDSFLEHMNISWSELIEFLRRWRRYLPDGPRPAINRNMLAPAIQRNDFFRDQQIEAGELELLFQLCDFLPGRGPKPGTVSLLAKLVLQWGSFRLVEEQFQPGGVLAGEDPELLFQMREQNILTRENSAAVLAYAKRLEERYEL